MLTTQEIITNYKEIKGRAIDICNAIGREPNTVKIIPVSKTHPLEVIIQAMEGGIKIFAENYVQECKQKYDELNERGTEQPEWHFIGHLQTNKVKYIAPYVSMIHSVDSYKLAKEINKHALKNERNIDILLQVNTSSEASKSGCEPDDVFDLYEQVMRLDSIKIKGLMTIAGLWGDKSQVRSEFKLLHELNEKINIQFEANLSELSMGMTGDFEMAIEEGSTMIRVGTAIFGYRD